MLNDRLGEEEDRRMFYCRVRMKNHIDVTGLDEQKYGRQPVSWNYIGSGYIFLITKEIIYVRCL